MSGASLQPNVALVEPSGRGGLAHFAYGLGNGLAARGCRVSLLTSGSYEMAGRPRRFELHRVFDRGRTNPLGVWRALRTAKADVVHLHGAAHPELYLAFLLGMRLFGDWTVVYSVHDLRPRQWVRFPNVLLRLLWRLPDRLVAHSSHVGDVLRSEFGVPADRISVVPHGEYTFLVGTPNGSSAGPTATPSDGDVAVLFFGYILPQKGLADLLEAFRIVARAMPSARLTVVGQPVEDFGPYRTQIRALGLDDRVDVHLGYASLDAMGRFLRAARVVALPYRSASQSGVLFAAYAFGRPVVATACGGLAEYIKPGTTGLLVPVGDPPALAAALVELLGDPERCRRMGEAAYTWSRTEFSWDRIAERVIEVYTGRESATRE